MAVSVENNTYFDDIFALPQYSEETDTSPLHQRYIVKEALGAGSFGTVARAVDRYTNEDVAVKIIVKDSLTSSGHKKALYREIKVLSMLNHRGVVKLHESFQDVENVYIVTELCPDGTLREHVDSIQGGVSEEEALLLMKQVLEALQHLHSKEIAHRDLKLDNAVFVGNELKLIDFGLCSARRPGGKLESTSYCGTPLYAAPEVMNHIPYIPEEADMWSCGIMLYAMLTGDKKFTGSSSKDLDQWGETFTPLVQVKLGVSPETVSGETPSLPELVSHISRGTAALLGNLLNEEPCQRPSVEQALDLLNNALWQFCYREV